jgi:hypothetical protein
LSFLGAAWSEETLIGCAFAYEKRTLARGTVMPVVLPRTQLNNVWWLIAREMDGRGSWAARKGSSRWLVSKFVVMRVEMDRQGWVVVHN